MTKPAWWGITVFIASVHIAVLIGTTIYCLDQYYDQPCPLDLLGYVLISPAYFLLPLFEELLLWPVWLVVILMNSFLWGCALAEPFRWWFGWPPWRFSVRTLLLLITVIAVLLGASAALKVDANQPIQPVVQPAGD